MAATNAVSLLFSSRAALSCQRRTTVTHLMPLAFASSGCREGGGSGMNDTVRSDSLTIPKLPDGPARVNGSVWLARGRKRAVDQGGRLSALLPPLARLHTLSALSRWGGRACACAAPSCGALRSLVCATFGPLWLLSCSPAVDSLPLAPALIAGPFLALTCCRPPCLPHQY